MGIEIRLPQITGATEREQLQQLKSYIYQLREQLQYAFDTISTTGEAGNGVYNKIPVSYSHPTGVSSKDAEATFGSIKALIIKSSDIVEAYYEEINKKLEGLYVAQSDFGTYAEQTKLEIDANSEAIEQNYENIQIVIGNAKNELNENIYNRVELAIAEANEGIDAAKSELSDEIAGAKNELDGKINDTNSRINDTADDIKNLGTRLDDANLRIEDAEGAMQETKDSFNEAIQTVTNSLSEADRLLHSVDEQLKGSIDNLQFDLSGLREVVVGVTAYVKSGLLYYTDEGIPVYGIEIGQEVEANGATAFKKYARFTSEKLSFYDANGNEVAYISDKKLFIGQAEITISLKVGGLVDLVLPNGDVITKWEGVT